jgi:hypothetical protein
MIKNKKNENLKKTIAPEEKFDFSATELKQQAKQIYLEEWRCVERARARHELLMKKENRKIMSPFLNGFRANFVAPTDTSNNLIKVHLSDDASIQVDIAAELRSLNNGEAMESLVKALVDGFMGGYLSALGIHDETFFKPKKNGKSGESS